jgi:hypothetical protein
MSELRTPKGARARVKEVRPRDSDAGARSALALFMASPRPGLCKPSRTHREND